MHPDKDSGPFHSLAGLFSQLADGFQTLIREEVALAKAEMSEKVRRLKSGTVELAAGGALAFIGVLFLLGAVVAALALVLPLWASSLIVGGATVAVGIGLLVKGRNQLNAAHWRPERTVQSLRRSKEWAKEKMT